MAGERLSRPKSPLPYVYIMDDLTSRIKSPLYAFSESELA